MLSHELKIFENSSDLAQQLVTEKPPYWEYKLTAELLREKMENILSRWSSLDKGLYTQPMTRVPLAEIVHWQQSKLEELGAIIGGINKLINSELPKSWGPPGVAGSEIEIFRVCDLLATSCTRLLDWEESVRFASVPNYFNEVQKNLIGIAGRQIDKLSMIPARMTEVLGQVEPKGDYHLDLVFDLPEGWQVEILQPLKLAARKAFL